MMNWEPKLHKISFFYFDFIRQYEKWQLSVSGRKKKPAPPPPPVLKSASSSVISDEKPSPLVASPSVENGPQVVAPVEHIKIEVAVVEHKAVEEIQSVLQPAPVVEEAETKLVDNVAGKSKAFKITVSKSPKKSKFQIFSPISEYLPTLSPFKNKQTRSNIESPVTLGKLYADEIYLEPCNFETHHDQLSFTKDNLNGSTIEYQLEYLDNKICDDSSSDDSSTTSYLDENKEQDWKLFLSRLNLVSGDRREEFV